MEEVISVVKSCIASCKGGIPLVDIDGEYRELVGESIPFNKFGFDTLGRFIKSVPDIHFEPTANGTVLTVADNKIAHLTTLIENQKYSHPKRKRMGRENVSSSQNISKMYRTKYSYNLSRVPEREDHWFSSRPYHVYSREEYYYTMQDQFNEREELFGNDRMTKMVGNVLTVTLNNELNQDDCDKSIQFLDGADSDIDNSECNVLHQRDNENMNTSLFQFYIEPTLFNHQMIGDDFFLHLAEKSLGAYTVRKSFELYSTGLCYSGQRIKDCKPRLMDAVAIADHAVLLVGAVDILEGTDVADLKYDMLDLISFLRRMVQSLVILTVPPLANAIRYERKWVNLKSFNKWLKELETDQSVHVVDTWKLLGGERMYDYYEPFPRRIIGSRAFIVLWNRWGCKQVIRFLRKKMFLRM